MSEYKCNGRLSEVAKTKLNRRNIKKYDRFEFIGDVAKYTLLCLISLWLTIFVFIVFFYIPITVWPQDYFFQFVLVGWMFCGISCLSGTFFMIVHYYEQLRNNWIEHSRIYYEDLKGSFSDYEVLPAWEKGLIVCGGLLRKFIQRGLCGHLFLLL